MVGFGSVSPPPSANTSIFQSLLEKPLSRLKVKPLPIQDPFSCYQALRPDVDQSFILESAPGPERLAEYTFLGFGPQSVIRLERDVVYIDGNRAGSGQDLLPLLRSLLEKYRLEDTPEAKYVGGLVGQIGYDFVPYLERVPRPSSPHPFPDVELGLYLDGIVFDHKADQAFYFTHHEDRSNEWLGVLSQAAKPTDPFGLTSGLACGVTQAGFEAAVGQAKEAIRQGEAYQIVLSRQLQGTFHGDPLSAYARLRQMNPSPYMYFLDFGERVIAGSSPEMLVAVQDHAVSTYPIAGTRPLGANEAERHQLAQELLRDEKERAEHVMLVDLARNDVGRVAEVGSVRVSQYMEVEGFSHVQHLVSCVQGQLRQGLDCFDALGSVFPAGTVSGAPKVRAMELIAELEPVARGPYAGVVGYASLNGNMDTAIAIRTAFFTEDQIFLQAGAGIVADSVPEREFLETEHKLGPMREVFSIRQAHHDDQTESGVEA